MCVVTLFRFPQIGLKCVIFGQIYSQLGIVQTNYNDTITQLS